MADDGEALGWIVDVLRRADVPFQVVGGLAARAYGARRPLVDLDFYVPTSRLDDVADVTAAYATRRPSHHRDECWDLTFMKLEYEGRPIELGGADRARYFDRHAGLWREAGIRFDASVEMTIFGIRVPVMPLDQLIEYKQRLDRDVDRQDVAEIALD
ncbi:MAG: hypothetical protein WD690_14490 [Vicinamibacterales bacterium]